MKMKTLLFSLTFLPFLAFSQAQYELHIGPSISNVRRMIEGEQVVFKFKENAPFWNFGFQIGANRMIEISPRTKFSIGCRLQLRGDLDGEFEIYPDWGDLNEIRFLYIIAPLNVMYKILPNRDIYIEGGISPDYLLDMNAPNPNLVYFPGMGFFDRFGLTGQLGYKFYFKKKWGIEFVYSQSLTNIVKIVQHGSTDIYDIESTFKNQAFEWSLYYKL